MKRKTQSVIKRIIKSCWEYNDIPVPSALLKYYKKLGLNEQEVMFILHIVHFQKLEDELFPSLEDLKNRMTANESQIMSMLQRLINGGYLKIDESKDDITDMHYEVYNTQPLFDQLSGLWLKEEGWMEQIERIYLESHAKKENRDMSSLDLLKEHEEQDLFTIFQKEFGRPLSPMEYERIVKWIQEDQFHKELITEALRQAVLIGKFNMLYIDRILFEWKKKNIRSIHEAQADQQIFMERKNTKQQNQAESKRSTNHDKDKELWYWLDIDSKEGR
ncbi:hypothetical protein BHU72_08240 [Desulfuribacillus stibiiarsenatis]|uniref:Uncharacterized protein n=1 Tax=Desulfuribacillus stibiiarsenatis TaxID=1390249 RepID=A0A1E5L441_9FIRM|nr:DnaD domain protein [Desulfuribacillus stibiiarsenatis]OEH84813.1 hypothetical protein BHU72_08240 [Desulfuribacillus stibiiarsenatis]